MRKGSGGALDAHTLRGSAVTSPEKQIGDRIAVQANGCWIFGDDPNKYGHASVGGYDVQAHRFVYETLRGPLRPGLHLHHRCETPACCNPAHLEALTPLGHARAHKKIRESREAS